MTPDWLGVLAWTLIVVPLVLALLVVLFVVDNEIARRWLGDKPPTEQRTYRARKS